MLDLLPRPRLPAVVSLTAIAHSCLLFQKSIFIQNLTVPGVQKVVLVASGGTNSVVLLMLLSSLWD